MNRIICDICGSEYAENEERCPVCGYARQGTEKIAAAGTVNAAAERVRGGQFSAKNVKKRRMAQEKAAAAAAAAAIKPEQEPEAPERESGIPEPEPVGKNPNKPLWITIALLLVAILLVSLYIGLRFFRGRDMLPAATTQPTETTQAPTVPCAGLQLESTVIALDEAGQEQQLVLSVLPENTTDAVCYVSSDESVAVVSDTGMVTAVGSGQAVITITCGQMTKECTVVCWFQEETTAPAETTLPPETTQPPQPTEETKAAETEPQAPAELTLDQSDVSFFRAGETVTIRVKLGEKYVTRTEVTWTSSDPNVVSVENGKVTAVGPGTATVTAKYDGKKAVCIFRCRFEGAQEGQGSQENQNDQNTSWRASASDVTLSVGESFRLTVKNGAGETADAIWTMSIDGVVSIDGKTITGRDTGTVTLTTTVDGVTLTCIVRVK